MATYKASFHIPDVSDGEDTLSLVVTPHAFTFQTDDKGEIAIQTSNTGKVKMYLGTTEVSPSKIEITERYNCIADVSEAGTLTIHSITKGQWSGFITISATYNGQVRTAKVEFIVSAQEYNEAQFEATSEHFKSIIAQNKADKQGLEQKISTIKQTADNIQLEVRQQTFSGVNLLKGASLRLLNLLSIDRPHVTIVSYPSVAHFDNPYLSIYRHGATQDEWNGCKFPVIKAIGGRTYTLSMYTKIYGDEQPYIEIKRSKSKDMSAPKNSYPNIPSTYGVWKLYTYTFEMEEGYNYLQIFIYLTRNGEAYLSEIQLEEGTKATTWKNPDIVESMQAAGIYLNGNDMSINARAKHFNYIDQQGNIVASVDETGAIDGLKFRTRNLGSGYIDLTGALMRVFGAVACNITFGLDEKGQAALKFYNNAGRNTLTISPDGTRAENMRIANFSSLEVCYIGGMQVAGYPAEHRIFDPFFTDRKPIGTSVYMYSAAQIDSVYIADGDWTQEQVKANNGRYFQRDMAVASNNPVNGVYAACQPQVKLRDNGRIRSDGGATDVAKEWSIITLYIFRDGRISTTQLRRERNL